MDKEERRQYIERASELYSIGADIHEQLKIEPNNKKLQKHLKEVEQERKEIEQKIGL